MIDSLPTGSAPVASRKYGNFRDPVGLVLRMLKSGNRAAYGALARAGLSIGMIPLDWLLVRNEQQRLAAADPNASDQPLLLIVGPPRSGSTLLHQTLARHLDVSYFSNLTALFPRAPITATRRLQRRTRLGRDDFESFYGQTAGLFAPNDGFEIWNRWLGSDRYVTRDALDDRATDDMRRFFAAWIAAFERPLLNKNNRNAGCLRLLAEVLPRASFVIIRREPLFVAQSLIEARLRVQGARDRSWGLSSTDRHADSGQPLGYVDDVCDQLIAIESRLQQQREGIESHRVIDLTYEALCRHPSATIEQIMGCIPQLRLRNESSRQQLAPFTPSSHIRLTNVERQRIERRIADNPILSSAHATRPTSPSPPTGERDSLKAAGIEAG